MIYIIRHGETDLNNRRVLQGRSNYPLNDAGIKQAQKAAEKFGSIHFEKVYSSPLKRALQTAEITAPYCKPIIDDRLIEMDYGPYEGLDLTNLPQEVLTFFKDFVKNPAPDGMEQLSSIVNRAGSFIEDIRCCKEDILISTHAIAMKGILEYLTPGSKGAYWSKYIGNCAVYTADNKDGKISIPYEI